MSSGLFSLVFVGPFYPDSGGVGMSFSKVNSDLMKFSGCFKFEDNEAAENAIGDIENDMGTEDFYQVEVNRSGNVVKFSAEIDKDEAGLFW